MFAISQGRPENVVLRTTRIDVTKVYPADSMGCTQCLISYPAAEESAHGRDINRVDRRHLESGRWLHDSFARLQQLLCHANGCAARSDGDQEVRWPHETVGWSSYMDRKGDIGS